MFRAVVNVATGEHYRKGQARLARILDFDLDILDLDSDLLLWEDLPHLDEGDNTAIYQIPAAWPSHRDKPYAFKAYALETAAQRGYDLLLWMDAAVKPVRSLEPLWERIERDGYWFAENAWNNYEWTADSAYPALFPTYGDWGVAGEVSRYARNINRSVPHVIACAFGLNLRSAVGEHFLHEYFRLASETSAFCGPWWNSNNPANRDKDPGKSGPCGPPDVIGHRHDQTAASLIAWQMGMRLTPGHRDPEGDILAYPEWFPERKVPERCILIHDGSMK